jgi:predicted TIM-barrel fold metal-dependent hydrolase
VVQTVDDRGVDAARSRTAPMIVVSGDSHVGPLYRDMRQYCPKALLDEFDEFGEAAAAMQQAMREGGGPLAVMNESPEGRALQEKFERGRMTAGHHDMHARIRDMDADGVAAEVIFHGSQNGEPVPFVAGPGGFSFDHEGDELDKTAAGLHIYNQWLADACSIEPERHVGCMILPMWDVDASIAELEWAANAGLRGVSFSAPRPGLQHYDHPSWEPFWSACEAHDVTLATHAGAIDFAEFFGTLGPHMFNLVEVEGGGWPCRKHMARMIFGGVFERHPNLRLVVTEQNGDWWTSTVREYDSSYWNHRFMIKDQVPDAPSEYLKRNVFIGASFIARFEAEMAIRDGYWENVVWGRDYPHIEGTYVYMDDKPDEENRSRLAMRWAFNGLPDEPVRAMVGENGLRAYHLDRDALQKVADRINAPSLEELDRPVAEIPRDGGVLAFRTIGPWW